MRRGALRRFDKLKSATAEMPVKLTWDRRLSERRASGGAVGEDRRQTDRRENPPFTWNTADFVVVKPAGRQAPRPKKTKRS